MSLRVKHVLDRIFAAVALLALSPMLVLIAAAVKLSSPGPVLFRQRRVGQGGVEFDLLKFRSMRSAVDADVFVPTEGLAPGGVEGSDRRTAIGTFLRNTSLDELPQLFNVLRGEMSLIGPRPERPEYVAQFSAAIPGYADRHRVKVGITGWAQANGLRGQTSIADRVRYDNFYIDNWTARLELRVLVLTLLELVGFDRGSAAGQPGTAEIVAIASSARSSRSTTTATESPIAVAA